jgi:hypothetical protein
VAILGESAERERAKMLVASSEARALRHVHAGPAADSSRATYEARANAEERARSAHKGKSTELGYGSVSPATKRPRLADQISPRDAPAHPDQVAHLHHPDPLKYEQQTNSFHSFYSF